MKKPFEVGEQIIVYDYNRRVAKVAAINPKLKQVKLEGSSDIWVHEKQCRRLVKKERRRFWISMGHEFGDHIILRTPPQQTGGWIEVVEVKKK